jgi:hypothetical protein
MVQALAFAEIFLGLILADAGYKGVSLSTVVKGEAGSSVAPAALGSTGSSTGLTSAGGEVPAGSAASSTTAAGGPLAPSPAKAGALTWGSLEREIKEGKLTETQVKTDLKALNHPPTG